MNHSPYIESSASRLFSEPDSKEKILTLEEIRSQTRLSLERKLVNQGIGPLLEKDLLNLPPDSISFDIVNYKHSLVLSKHATDERHSEVIFGALRKPISLRHLRSFHIKLLEKLRSTLPNPTRMIELLPMQIEPQLPSGIYSDSLIIMLFELGFSEQIWQRLPTQLPEFSKLGGGFLSILHLFQARGTHQDEILHVLPKVLDLNKMRYQESELILEIINTRGTEEIVSRLPDYFDLTLISEYGSQVVHKLFRRGHKELILNRLPSVCNLDSLSDGAITLFRQIDFPPLTIEPTRDNRMLSRKLLDSLKPSQEQEPFFRNETSMTALSVPIEQNTVVIPATINLESISVNAAIFIYEYVNRNEILRRLPKSLANTTISEGGGYLLSELIRSGDGVKKVKKLIQEYLETAPKFLRKPIHPSELRGISEKVGPYFFEVIDDFPIVNDSIEKLKNNWFKAEVEKGGSKSFVFLRLEPDSEKIIFRSTNYDPKSLDAYRLAVKQLPLYISCQWYQELVEQHDGQILPKINPPQMGLGFREVFAGASFGDYASYNLPGPIKQSICQQIMYIKTQLFRQGIRHNDDHPWNYNLRFLLSSPDDSDKHISFDLNAAIQVAVEKGWYLTPIVTLRDWDKATITVK